jgi:hypothetical protein
MKQIRVSIRFAAQIAKATIQKGPKKALCSAFLQSASSVSRSFFVRFEPRIRSEAIAFNEPNDSHDSFATLSRLMSELCKHRPDEQGQGWAKETLNNVLGSFASSVTRSRCLVRCL